MGLDITAYKNLVKVESPELDSDGDVVNHDHVKFWDNHYFPGRSEGIDCAAVYSYEDVVSFGWSYGGYNRLRNQLAQFAGYVSDEEAFGKACGPFWELINFADNEGTLGPVVCTKLAADFASYEAKALAHESEEFREFYKEMKEAVDTAAQNGAIKFH